MPDGDFVWRLILVLAQVYIDWFELPLHKCSIQGLNPVSIKKNNNIVLNYRMVCNIEHLYIVSIELGLETPRQRAFLKGNTTQQEHQKL